jgi:hypothetical protein
MEPEPPRALPPVDMRTLPPVDEGDDESAAPPESVSEPPDVALLEPETTDRWPKPLPDAPTAMLTLPACVAPEPVPTDSSPDAEALEEPVRTDTRPLAPAEEPVDSAMVPDALEEHAGE